MLDRQKLFDLVSEKLIAQGRGSFTIVDSNRVSCAYRNTDGLKCAIGHLIPDELYDPKMENGTAFSVLNNFPKLKNYIFSEFKSDAFLHNTIQEIEFLDDLQLVHDSSCSVDTPIWDMTEFKKSLTTFANKYSLTTNF